MLPITHIPAAGEAESHRKEIEGCKVEQGTNQSPAHQLLQSWHGSAGKMPAIPTRAEQCAGAAGLPSFEAHEAPVGSTFHNELRKMQERFYSICSK